MRLTRSILAAAVVFGVTLCHPAAEATAADRLKVEFTKKPTDAKSGLEYEYTFTVKKLKSGETVSGADFMIATDMPAMPGAHHMPHVKGEPGETPGSYRAKIDFDMAGGWNLILRFKKPHRDQVVVSDEVARQSGGAGHAGHQNHDMHKGHKMAK
ncbi:MAG: FixH family protein [Methyloligellaceae bacterium]